MFTENDDELLGVSNRSDAMGVKFDRLELLDLDEDGDLNVVKVRPKSEHDRLLEIIRRRGRGTMDPRAIDRLVQVSRQFNKDWLEERELFERTCDEFDTDDEEET